MKSKKAKAPKEMNWGELIKVLDAQAIEAQKLLAQWNINNPPHEEVQHRIDKDEFETYGLWFLLCGSVMYGIKNKKGYNPNQIQTLPRSVVKAILENC